MKKAFVLITVVIFFLACNNQASDTAAEAKKDSTGTNTSNSAEDKEERNKKIAMESLEAVQNLNADAILKDAASDIVDYGDGSMPPLKSLDSAKAFLKTWLDAIESMKVNNVISVADGDYVMVYGDWEGKYKKDFMGMKTAGKTFKVRDVDIFKFNDAGKITEHRAVQALDTYLKSMGISMPKH